MTERRSRRSQDHVEALALFLESQRDKLQAGALAVTTRDGQLLAAAGPSPERLARKALQLHEARDDVPQETMNIATWWLRAGVVDVILASHGGRLSHDLGSGVKRILTSS
jgi:hypothetical protein